MRSDARARTEGIDRRTRTSNGIEAAAKSLWRRLDQRNYRVARGHPYAAAYCGQREDFEQDAYYLYTDEKACGGSKYPQSLHRETDMTI